MQIFEQISLEVRQLRGHLPTHETMYKLKHQSEVLLAWLALKNNAACFLKCIQEKRLQRELLAVPDDRLKELFWFFFFLNCFSDGKVTQAETFQRP